MTSFYHRLPRILVVKERAFLLLDTSWYGS